MIGLARLTPDDISEAMQVPLDVLWRWSRDTSILYKPARKEVIRGKERIIEAPYHGRKKALRRLHRFLQRSCPGHPNAHGGVRGRSCFTGAKKHLGRRIVLTRDITNCYPNIHTKQLRKRLVALGCSLETATLLARLSSVRDHLPQGSPVSSDMLNLFLYDADRRLKSLEANDVAIHRCYDDFVASANSSLNAALIGESIEAEIQVHGLEVNETKKAKNGFKDRTSRQLVHNLDVSNPAGVAIRKEDIQKATTVAENYVRAAKAVNSNTLELMARKRQRLLGYICHFSQAKFSNVDHLRRLLKHGDRHVAQALLKKGLDPTNWYANQGKNNRAAKLAMVWRAKLARSSQHALTS